MPTLRVELLKSREEEDQKKPMISQEKKVVHCSRVNMLAGYPSHATKLKYTLPELPKQRKEKPITGKSPCPAKKLPKSDANRTSSHPSPHSSSESDSFSIKSSSSSSKSEADSIKKPSPPTTSPAMPKNASLSMSLGSYLGAQAMEMWSSTHMSPLSKAVHEKLSGERALQDCFLEFKFSEGSIVVDKHPTQRKNDRKALQCTTTEHLRDMRALKQDTMRIDALKEEHGTATPAFYSATDRSPESSSETSFHSSDASLASPAGQDSVKPIRSIKELMCQHQAPHGKTGGVLHAEHRSSFAEDRGQMHGYPIDPLTDISQKAREQLSRGKAPFEGEGIIDRVLLKPEISSDLNWFEAWSSQPKPLPCNVSEGGDRHDDRFSFKSVPMPQGAHTQDIPLCGQASMDPSTHPEMVATSSKEARVSLEKYVYSTPVVGKLPSSTQNHSERGKFIPSPRSLGHELEGMRQVTRVVVGSLTPPPVHEIRCKSNLEEFTPVSPLSLGDVSSYQRLDEGSGKESVGKARFVKSEAEEPLHSPSKAHWDWRSRSIGARASLRSAVRNLEAAFGGSRSASLPKARSQTHQREQQPELSSSKFMNRVFVSPVKARHNKRAEGLQPMQSSYSGDHVTQDCLTSRRTPHRADHSSGASAVSSQVVLPPLHQSKHQKSEISDFKVPRVPILPALRTVQDGLAPLKRLSSHTTTPAASSALPSSTSQPNSSRCMLQGYLQCIANDGNPCYTLSLRDCEEMLLAKACAFKHNSSMEGYKCQYTFHSGRSKSRGKGANGWRSWRKKDTKSVSDLVGKMQVSSQLCMEDSPAGRRTENLVSEFVLYEEERSDEAVRSQSLRFLSSGSTCHTSITPAAESPASIRSTYELVQSSVLHRKQAVDISRSPRMSLKSVDGSHATPYSQGTPTHQSSYSVDVCSDSDVTEPEMQHPSGLSVSLHSELAAMVIKIPTDEPVRGACRRFSHDELKGSEGERKDGMLEEIWPASECVTVMLPKEHHGMPKGGAHGPTSLIERWKCGGKCDCGGWDLGCGMKVFGTQQQCQNLSMAANLHNTIQSLSQNQPLIIYSQGKTCEPLLHLSLIQEGYFIVKFENDLPPLKAFAASIAILHSRESSLTIRRRKLTENHTDQQCETDPDREDPALKGSKRPDLLEVCKEIPTWCPSSRTVSPYGRA